MIFWGNAGQQLIGESDATDWRGAAIDIADALEKISSEQNSVGDLSIYLEMWPDSGRMICYLAAPPNDGNLAERVSVCRIQLMLPFWQEMWVGISSDKGSSETKHYQLRRSAIESIIEAFKIAVSRCDDKAQFVIYAFEFEGSEGITVITHDRVYEIG